MENIQDPVAETPVEAAPKSTVLSEQEVDATLNGTEEETQVLPSDDSFVMPDKFKGKSAEEIARAYAELEKLRSQPKEEPAEPVQEAAQKDIPEDQFNKFVSEYDSNGELSAESYKALEDLGYSKEAVDERIDFIAYKRDKAVEETLKPYGGKAEFEKVSNWAQQNFSEEQLNNINAQLASGNKQVQDAVLSSLFMGYKQSSKPSPDMTLHTNQPQATKAEGYATKSEYLKDAKDPRYDRDAGYRKQVEQKMLKTDMSKWY